MGRDPSDEVPEDVGEHPASGMTSLPPPGPPAAPPGEVTASGGSSTPGAGEVGPYGDPVYAAPEQPRLSWILVVVGIPIGFVAWVVGSLLLLGLTGTLGGTGSGSVLTLVLLVLLLAASVGLIVWRRTRRLAQGFVLGAAIGLVVAGGLCIPLVSSF